MNAVRPSHPGRGFPRGLPPPVHRDPGIQVPGGVLGNASFSLRFASIWAPSLLCERPTALGWALGYGCSTANSVHTPTTGVQRFKAYHPPTETALSMRGARREEGWAAPGHSHLSPTRPETGHPGGGYRLWRETKLLLDRSRTS